MDNNQKTIDYAEANNLTTVETTSQANGYPSNLRHVLTFDRITDALNHSDHLQKLGHTVTELCLEKRDGQQLWSRRNGNITHGMFRKVSDSDWTLELFTDTTRCDTEEVAFELIAKDRNFEDLEEMRKAITNIEEMKEEMENILSEVEDRGGTEATIFYDPDQNYRINYWADMETVGYSYDTHSYMIALMVDFKDND